MRTPRSSTAKLLSFDNSVSPPQRVRIVCFGCWSFLFTDLGILSTGCKRLVTRAKGLQSPKQLSFSARDKRVFWSDKEDCSLVQFIALHRDLQPTSTEWPSVRSNHEYWEHASKFMGEMTGSSVNRKGKTPTICSVFQFCGRFMIPKQVHLSEV